MTQGVRVPWIDDRSPNAVAAQEGLDLYHEKHPFKPPDVHVGHICIQMKRLDMTIR